MKKYHQAFRSANFFCAVLDLDFRCAAEAQAKRCRRCGGPLHRSRYPRKPRGVPEEFKERFSKRWSFTCGAPECRRRTTPPSVCFLGRRVYIAVSFVLLSMLRYGVTDKREEQLRRELHAEFPVDESTLRRWREWWCHILTATPFWRAAKGQLRRAVLAADLPAGLLKSFTGDAAQQLIFALKFFAPLSTSSCRFWSGMAMVS